MAAIYHNQYNNNFSSGGSTSISFSYTCSSKDNKVLLIILRIHAGSISDLSYAGAPLTLLATNGSMSLYGLLAPKAGSNTVNMGCATSSIVLISAADFSGVDQINTYTPTVSATGSGTAFSTPKLSLVTGGVGYGGFYTNYTNATGSFTGSGNTTLLSATRDAGSGKRNGHGINFEPNSLNWTFSGAGVAWWSIGVGLTPHEEMSGKYKPPRVYRQYTSQPQQLTGIENLAAEAAIWTATAPTTAIVRRASVNGNPVNPIYGISEAGKSVYWTDGSSSTNGINFSRLFNTNTSEFTILILAQPVAEAVIRIPFAQKESGSIFIPNMTLLFNASGGSPESGSISIYARDNNAFGRNLRATNQIDGELHCWVLSMSSTTGGSIFRDGVSQTLATNDNLTGGSLWGTNAVSNIGSGYGGDFTSRFPYPLHLVAVWPRKLSMAAQAYLSANPNTIFAPLKVYPFISSEAAQSPISNRPLTLDKNPRKTSINPSIGVPLNSKFPAPTVLVPRGRVMVDTNTNLVPATFGVSGTVITTLFGIALSWGGEAHYGFPPASVLIVRLGRVTPDSSILSNHSIGGGQYTHKVIIGSTGYYEIYSQSNVLQNTSTVLAKEGDVLALSLLPGNTAKLYTPYETLNSGTEIGTGNSFRIGRTELTKTAAKSFLFAAAFSKLTEQEIKYLISNPDELFAPTNKFIQTAYAPKAPWSVARSRVLGTSTGAPATVATAAIKQVDWSAQPQGAMGIDSRASSVYTPAMGLQDAFGRPVTITGTLPIVAGPQGLARNNETVNNYLSLSLPATTSKMCLMLVGRITGPTNTDYHTIFKGNTATTTEIKAVFNGRFYTSLTGGWTNSDSGTAYTRYQNSTLIWGKDPDGRFRLYNNGVPGSGSYTDAGVVASTWAAQTWNFAGSPDATFAAGFELAMFAFFPASFASEINNDYGRNPWQLFASRNLQIPVGV